jgi:hypothetical protein
MAQLKISKEMDNAKGIAESFLHLGSLEQEQDNYQEATTLFKMGLQIAMGTNSTDHVILLNFRLAQSYALSNFLEEAREEFSKTVRQNTTPIVLT